MLEIGNFDTSDVNYYDDTFKTSYNNLIKFLKDPNVINSKTTLYRWIIRLDNDNNKICVIDDYRLISDPKLNPNKEYDWNISSTSKKYCISLINMLNKLIYKKEYLGSNIIKITEINYGNGWEVKLVGDNISKVKLPNNFIKRAGLYKVEDIKWDQEKKVYIAFGQIQIIKERE